MFLKLYFIIKAPTTKSIQTSPKTSFASIGSASIQTFSYATKPSSTSKLTTIFSKSETTKKDDLSNSTNATNKETISLILNSLNFSKNGFDFDDIIKIGNEIALQLLSDSSQDLSACITNCSNNGRCKLGSDLKLECDCFDNFAGKSCKTDLRPCSYYPCLKRGICEDQVNNSFFCNCSYPYFGSRCENEINVCQNHSCNNNGFCFENSSLPTCKCYNYYSGENCEIQDSLLKKIKSMISATSIAAIFILICFYSMLIISDIVKQFFTKRAIKTKPINRETNKEVKQYAAIKNTYKN